MDVDQHSIDYILRDLEEMKTEMKLMRADIDSRVKYQHFTWILGILMMVVIGLLGVIYVQVKDTAQNVTEMQKQVGLIQYRLDSAEITR